MLVKPRIELVCTGTELLRDTINTNVISTARFLMGLGHELRQDSAVGDDPDDLSRALKQALERSEIVLVSGGLGPTFDDLTRDCAARTLGLPLVFLDAILKDIESRFAERGLAMPAENRRQAYVIKGARIMPNRFGTAPGQIVEHKGKTLILLPGPPRELIPMLETFVGPYLKKNHPAPFTQSLVLHVFGHPESEVDERIAPVVERTWGSGATRATFGILAHRSIIDVKAFVESPDRGKARTLMAGIRRQLLAVLENDVYGENNDTLESVVGDALKKRRKTLALAESCTGGLIAHKITGISGSSAYFRESVVTYSNESKMRLLGVKRSTLDQFGAVSAQAAEEMAAGVLKRAGSDWSVAVTGIAGPTGGTVQKPVGLVWFGLASKQGVMAVEKRFYGDRAEIKERAALTALDLLRRKIS